MINLGKIDEIIKYGNESVYVDFKKEYYYKEESAEKIKDILAMANAHTEEQSRYIIFGVKHFEDGKKIFESVEIEDVANVEQLIQSNIEPDIKLKLYTYVYEGFELGILEIYDCNNRPYITKKKYRGIQEGTLLIRSGTTTRYMERNDLERIYEKKNGKFNSEDIKFSFESKKNQHMKVTIRNENSRNLRSKLKKRQLEKNLLSLQQHKVKKEKLTTPEAYARSMFANEFLGDRLLTGFNTESKMPIYKSEKELKEAIENIPTDYSEKDLYYIQENIAQDLNFYILNVGTQFLTDVYIEIRIPTKIGYIFTDKVKDPEKNMLHANPFWENLYPAVKIEESNYIIFERFDRLRHGVGRYIFEESLKVDYDPKLVNGIIEVEYEIHAKELNKPVHGVLELETLVK